MRLQAVTPVFSQGSQKHSNANIALKHRWYRHMQIFVVFKVLMTKSVASHISETSEAKAIKFDKVTASVMTMSHISILVALILIYGHTSMFCTTLGSVCFSSTPLTCDLGTW